MRHNLKPFSQLRPTHLFFPPRCAYSTTVRPKMILELVDNDLLNTRLVDVQSGRVQFRVSTRASYSKGYEDGVVIVASRHTVVFDSEGVVAEIE